MTGDNHEIKGRGFGPFNIAIIIETLTDNKNRAASSDERFTKEWRKAWRDRIYKAHV